MTKPQSITHTRKFRIRYYESDPNGLLSCSNYLRFMQEIAFDASSAGGYNWEQYKKMNRIWVIRDTEVHAIKPVYYDQTLLAKTWISDFHGITSRREYAFFRIQDKSPTESALVAKGYSDWVFLDTKNARPVNIPQEFQRKFFPDGLPETFTRRKRFTLNNNIPESAFTTRKKVELQDIDQLQHMNNASYLDHVLETNWQMFENLGISFYNLQQKQKTLLAHLSHIRYKVPAHFQDSMKITSWISNLTTSKIEASFLIRRESDNALLVQGQLEYVYIDLDTQLAKIIPTVLQESLKKIGA